MNRFAKEGANFVPIAVPPTCRYSLSLNSKLFVVSTSSNSLQMEKLVGFCVAVRFRYKNFETASMPSELGMLVYRLVTSKVVSMELSGNFRSPMMFKRWLLSLKLEGKVGIRGCMKWSTNLEIRSDGQLLVKTIGLPGGGI